MSFLSLFLLVGLLIWLLRNQATGPLGSITKSIRLISEGASDVEIGMNGRRDEIGQIAEALRILRANEQERAKLAADQLRIAEEKAQHGQRRSQPDRQVQDRDHNHSQRTSRIPHPR